MSSVHFIIQGKGGIGKSLISSLIAQFQKDELGLGISCLNTDPVNDSFYDFKDLNVKSVPIIENHQIVPREFDKIIEMIIQTEDHFIIDNGASSFIPLLEFLSINPIIDVLNDFGKTVYFHTPVTGGPAQKDTLTALARLMDELPQKGQIVIWENRYFGEINFDGITLKDIPFIKKAKDRIAGFVTFGAQKNYFTADFSKMLQNKHTFKEATASDSTDYFIMEKQRLLQIKRELFPQIGKALGHSSVGV